jgi:dimethylhistidine N-methyltransferase
MTVALRETREVARFAADVRESLTRTPRQLSSRYFYDALGSALFDAICQLPWYRITRAELGLLAAHRDAIHQHLPRLSTIVELGPGNGEKLKLLLDSGVRRQRRLDLHLVDVSSRALQTAAETLGYVPDVRIIPHVAEYDAGLRHLAPQLPGGGQALVLFLGSNIGNLDAQGAADFLQCIRRNLSHGDALLLGADLIKPERELRLAYDDPLGVTAAFNRNLLVRINAELGGDFDVRQFRHQAAWNPAASRMEMSLIARSEQRVRISALPMELTLAAGERIWTESSHKYQADGVKRMLEEAGFSPGAQWIEHRDNFALTLAIANR